VVLGTENLRSGIQEALQTAHRRQPEKDGLGEGPFPIPRSPRLEVGAVDSAVAISAERDQIFVHVVTQSASRAQVVNLEVLGTPAVLASPAVTHQYFGAELAIRIWVEPKPRSSWLKIIHRTFPICSTNSIFCGSGSNEKSRLSAKSSDLGLPPSR